MAETAKPVTVARDTLLPVYLAAKVHLIKVHLIHEWVTWRVRIAKRFDALPSGIPDEVLLLAMGVRTSRAAHEFGRNKLRFEGMSHFLSDILALVEKPEPTTTMIPLLREAEIALDSKHRAWLRLMIEAKWFG